MFVRSCVRAFVFMVARTVGRSTASRGISIKSRESPQGVVPLDPVTKNPIVEAFDRTDVRASGCMNVRAYIWSDVHAVGLLQILIAAVAQMALAEVSTLGCRFCSAGISPKVTGLGAFRGLTG